MTKNILISPLYCRSDWDLRRSGSCSLQSTRLETPDLISCCDCVDKENVTKDQECQGCVQACSTPAMASDKKRRGMKKYQALIRLNNSSMSVSSDVSTLNLTNLDESRPELDMTCDSTKAVTAYYTIDSRRLASKHQRNQDERKLLYGIKHFNLNSKKGLKILQESGFVDESPESVAKFLFRQERLSKKQIGTLHETLVSAVHIFQLFPFPGKYLGSHEDFNKQVLQHFVECHQFTHLLLVQALRQFLWSFR